MIRIAAPPRPNDSTWHEVFLRLAPTIETYARVAFGHLGADARAEAIQGVLCYACCVIARLAELGKLDLCYASVLARYGVAQVKEGRQLGGQMNCQDVASPSCRWRHGVEVERLDQFDRRTQTWREVLVEDRSAGPADVAAMRIDFGRWLGMLSARDRQIAEALGAGHSTVDVAERFGVSASRVSQLRREFAQSWCRFQRQRCAAEQNGQCDDTSETAQTTL